MSPRAARELDQLRRTLDRAGAASRVTVYECPDCQERFVGQQRCGECQRFCRALGLGGSCPDCDQVLLLGELLAQEAPPA